MKTLDYEKLVHTYAGLAARYFLDYVALVERCQEGIEDVEQEAERIRRASAQRLGASLATKATRRDLIDLRELYWSKFPNVEIIELQPDHMVARAYTCAFCDGLRSLGVDAARMKALSDLGCLPDEAAASGFNPAIKLQLETRQMKGSHYCEWILDLPAEAETEPPGDQPSPRLTRGDETVEARSGQAAQVGPPLPVKTEFEKYVLNFKEIRALYFLDYVDFIEAYRQKPDGNPVALARQVRYDSAHRQGVRLAKQTQEATLEQLIERYWYGFPYTEALELNAERAIVRAYRDPFYEAFQQLGVSEDRIRGFSDLFCLVEEGATKGFNPQIEFQQRKHFMLGDTYSEWELKLSQD